MKWAIAGVIAGLALAATAAYLLPERETAITRDVFTAEIQRTVNEVGPLVRDLK